MLNNRLVKTPFVSFDKGHYTVPPLRTYFLGIQKRPYVNAGEVPRVIWAQMIEIHYQGGEIAAGYYNLVSRTRCRTRFGLPMTYDYWTLDREPTQTDFDALTRQYQDQLTNAKKYQELVAKGLHPHSHSFGSFASGYRVTNPYCTCDD